jgi:DMSO reductase anchor subunit
MHPALSVIFFTSVSGLGYGLLFLAGLAYAIDPSALDPIVGVLAAVFGIVFAAAGLTSSMLHLGQPLRAWRAFSQWRSSWLSREGVASVICFGPALVLGALVWHHGNAIALQTLTPSQASALRVVGALLAVCATGTVFCTARIYTSLKTIQAWHNGYVLPGYLLFALLGGAAWLWILQALAGAASARWLRDGLPALIGLSALAAWLLKLAYWRFIDTAPSASTAESATGLGRYGSVSGVEAPHTEENYLTREMGFALARKHAARLRVMAQLLFIALPLVCVVVAALLALASQGPPYGVVAVIAVIAGIGVIAGTFVERWLFFAEAKHVVMLYYAGARSEAA